MLLSLNSSFVCFFFFFKVSSAAVHTLVKFASTRASCVILIQSRAVLYLFYHHFFFLSCQFDSASYIVPLIATKSGESTLLPSLELLSLLTGASDEAILGAIKCEAVPALQKVVNDFPELSLQCFCNLAKVCKTIKQAIKHANRKNL